MTEVMEEKDELSPEGHDSEDELDTSVEHDEDNLLANLRAKRQEISEARHLDLEIPGYDGELVARYIPVEWDVIKDISKKLEKSKNPRKELYAQADVLARTCEQILVRVRGTLKPMGHVFPELGAETVAFDPNLGKALDFEMNSHSPGRSAVLQSFNNDLAVAAQHNEVLEWIQSSNRDDDEDF